MTDITDAQLRAAMGTAADKFESEEWKWRQDGSYGYGKLLAEDEDSGKYCVVGGCGKGLGCDPVNLPMSLFHILDKCVLALFPDRYCDAIFGFNDHASTTKADVIAVLRCGAEGGG